MATSPERRGSPVRLWDALQEQRVLLGESGALLLQAAASLGQFSDGWRPNVLDPAFLAVGIRIVAGSDGAGAKKETIPRLFCLITIVLVTSWSASAQDQPSEAKPVIRTEADRW